MAGPNNTVYQTSQNATGGQTFTFVTVAGPGGIETTEGIEGGLQGSIVVDDDGNAYLTTTDGPQSFVNVVNSDGVVVAKTPLSREALGGVVLGTTGVAYQTTRSAMRHTWPPSRPMAR